MSVEYSVTLVDWQRFQALWKKYGDASFLYEDGPEETDDWILELGPRPLWNSSWNATIAFSDAYRKMRKFLDPVQSERFEAFFSAFCLTDEDEAFHPPRDLGEDIDELVFWATIAPETARSYLALWDALDMEELRPAHAQLDHTWSSHWVDTFESFRQQPEMWADLLRDAVGKNAGIVVVTA